MSVTADHQAYILIWDFKMEKGTKRRPDLRVVKTKEAIKNAFKAMICEMPADKITVKELTERARIHRKTFYLHYNSIEALYEEMLKIIAEGYYEEMDRLSVPYSFKEVNRVFFTYFPTQEKYVERLMCDESYGSIINRLFAETLRHNLDRYDPYAVFNEQTRNLINVYFVTASLEMYRQWVRDGKKLSVDELAKVTGCLMDEGISGLMGSVEKDIQE